VSPRAESPVTGTVTVDRRERTIVLTVLNVSRRRAATVYLTIGDARKLAKMLKTYAAGPA
jgi:hypothetical protein